MEHQASEKPNMGEIALSYHRAGFHIFPIEWRTNIPKSRHKRPLIKWEHLQYEHETEEWVIDLWKKWPDAGIGIATGAGSGIVVVDIETVEGLEAFIAECGDHTTTLTQKTGKPAGFHLIFKHPKDGLRYQNQTKVLKDVDTRGDGGYIVAAPSMHPDGKRYQWVTNDFPSCGMDVILDLPESVKKIFKPYKEDGTKRKKSESNAKQNGSKETGDQSKKNPDGWVQDFLNGVDEGQRNDWAAKLAGYYLRVFKGDIDQVRETMRMANERNRPPLEWKELEKVIESIASRCGTDDLGNAVGEEIKKIEILKYPDGTRKYNVFLENVDGYAQMTLKELGMFSHFKWRFGEIADYIPTNVKQDRWEQKVNKALNEAVIVDIPEEETPMGMVISSIERAILAKDITSDPKYINSRVLMVGDNGDRQICLRIPTVMSMIKFEGDRLTRKEVGELLRKIGFNNKEHVRLDNGNIRCWAIPLDRWKFNTTSKPDK